MHRTLLWGPTLLLIAVLGSILAIDGLDIALTTPALRADLMHQASRYPALAALQANDAVHYGAHLVAGRTLSLCPCTRDLAAIQYSKALWHARTPHQRALLTTDRPHTAWGIVTDALQLSASSLRWIGGHLV